VLNRLSRCVQAPTPLARFGQCLRGLRLWAPLCGAVLAWALSSASVAQPGQAQPAAADPVLEARVMKISAELRCLVCQNQTIADSNAGLAVDLRNQVRDMLKRGDTPEQITEYMTARYGDFVLYRPPVKGSTAVLWYGPAALLVLAVAVLLVIVRRRTKLPPERFEADPEGTSP
jgi:cytochrome c-type biogenesis protein CcmH